MPFGPPLMSTGTWSYCELTRNNALMTWPLVGKQDLFLSDKAGSPHD